MWSKKLIDDLCGVCLVASEKIRYNDYLSDTVIFLYEHDEFGSKGVIINRVLDTKNLTGGADFKELVNLIDKKDLGLLYFGPIASECFFVIKQKEYGYGLECKLSANPVVSDNVVAVGVGNVLWGSGALLNDLRDGKWHIFNDDVGSVFEVAVDDRFDCAMSSLGVAVGSVFVDKVGNS